jgi:hypothetical protein
MVNLSGSDSPVESGDERDLEPIEALMARVGMGTKSVDAHGLACETGVSPPTATAAIATTSRGRRSSTALLSRFAQQVGFEESHRAPDEIVARRL